MRVSSSSSSTVLYTSAALFAAGLYYYVSRGRATATATATAEGYRGGASSARGPRCPDMLIQKGSRYFLLNSKLATVPGVNPIEFDSLEDYTEFLDWQRSQNIRCPVLFVQETFDAQGKKVWKSRPAVDDVMGGLPPEHPNPTLLVDAGRNDPPYNRDAYPAFDQTFYYVGATTPLDVMNLRQETATISPNPMDSNWGGADYTRTMLS